MRTMFWLITVCTIFTCGGGTTPSDESPENCPPEGCPTDTVCSSNDQCQNVACPGGIPQNCCVFSCDHANGTCRYTLVDNDGDGIAVAGACGGTDCDDDDRTVYPGAPRICVDGADHDCDDINDCEQEEDTTDPTCAVPVDLAPGSGTLPDDCDDSAVEPENDSFAGADELDFTNGGYGCDGPCDYFQFDLATCYPSDIDYWRFNVFSGQALDVVVSSDSASDLTVALLNETGEVITTSDCPGDDPEEVAIAGPVTEDREYYLAVRGSIAGHYSVSFDLRPR